MERFPDIKIRLKADKYQKLWVWFDSTHIFEYLLLIFGYYTTIKLLYVFVPAICVICFPWRLDNSARNWIIWPEIFVVFWRFYAVILLSSANISKWVHSKCSPFLPTLPTPPCNIVFLPKKKIKNKKTHTCSRFGYNCVVYFYVDWLAYRNR